MSDANTKTILENTIEIADPEDPNIKYEFRVPGIKDQLTLGMKARAIRRANDPTGSGDLLGLDQETAMLSWSLGAFETLLTASGAKWPYSEDANKKPVVDYQKFPPERFDTVLHVGLRLDAEIGRFRKNWTANWKSTEPKTVDGSSNPGA